MWNDRKPQSPDNNPHQTDAALSLFREWFDGFAYAPGEPYEVPVALRTACGTPGHSPLHRRLRRLP